MYSAKGWELKIFTLQPENNRLVPADIFPEIVSALGIAIVGGVLTLYAENRKVFTRFVQKIGATRTYGDEDVWDFVFNSSSAAVNFVHVRDFEQQVVYAGYVEVFSETGRLRELVLSNVIVYDFDGAEMYKVPRLYLARERPNVHIEFPVGSEGNP